MDKTDDGSDSQRAEASVFFVVKRGSVFRVERGGGKAKRIIFVRLRPTREGAAAGRNEKQNKYMDTAETTTRSRRLARNTMMLYVRMVLMMLVSRLSAYLMLVVALPLMWEAPYLLRLWLGQVPEHAVDFVRIFLLVGLNTTLVGPTVMAVHATGRIRRFQLVEGTLLLTVVPVGYVLLRVGHVSANQVLLAYLGIEVLTQLVRVWLVYPMIGLRVAQYYTKVMWPIVKVGVVVWMLPAMAYPWAHAHLPELAACTVVVATCVASTALWTYVLGLNRKERRYVCEVAAGRLARWRRTDRLKGEEKE